MLWMKGTETASSRSVEEEGGRYDIAVKNNSVRSIGNQRNEDMLKSLG